MGGALNCRLSKGNRAMNNLNSILVEGTIKHAPFVCHDNGGHFACRFIISSQRVYRDANNMLVECPNFFIIESDGELAKVAKNKVVGERVRVVGRLRQDREICDCGKPFSEIVIVAEHIEYRPAALPRQIKKSSTRKRK